MTEATERLHILIVEDDEQLRQILREVLLNDGQYQVTACESGEEALQRFKEQIFDIVLLDYKMPGISGLNVLQWMFEQKLETPVIMLTGAGSEIIAVEAMKLGAYDYIRKELVDIEHLPIIINGVHERYLFKKEKEHRSLLQDERERDLRSIQEFRDMVLTMTQVMDNALKKMSSTIEQYREDPSELKQYQSVIAFGMRSILDSSGMLCDRLLTERGIRRDQTTSPDGEKVLQERNDK